jgi:threonine-phosphate decarboxylase
MDPNAVDELGSPDGVADGSVGATEEPSQSQTGGEDGRVPHGGATDPLALDFSANTNPCTPDGVARVYDSALSAARSYPSDDYYEYRATAAEYVGCEATQVIPTGGGLGAIRLAIATAVGRDDEVLVPYPSFGEYAREIRLQGGEPAYVPYDEILETDPDDYALAVVCNPNNPTGNSYDADRLYAYADRCRDAGTPLLVDEAFIGFTEEPSLVGHEGVIVTRCLTKLFGLPGLRAGFAVAAGTYRDRLDTARQAWGLGTAASSVGAHCMKQEDFVSETRERVRNERARMRRRLAERFEVHPSDAPFLLLDAGSSEAVDGVLASAREHNIEVRDARTFCGLDQHVRVAVRLPYENDRLFDALDV